LTKLIERGCCIRKHLDIVQVVNPYNSEKGDMKLQGKISKMSTVESTIQG